MGIYENIYVIVRIYVGRCMDACVSFENVNWKIIAPLTIQKMINNVPFCLKQGYIYSMCIYDALKKQNKMFHF